MCEAPAQKEKASQEIFDRCLQQLERCIATAEALKSDLESHKKCMQTNIKKQQNNFERMAARVKMVIRDLNKIKKRV